MKPTWCTFHSVYWVSRASTCFEHYLLIFRRRYTNGIWYIAWVCQLTVAWLQWNVCVALPEDEQVMFEKCRGPWFSINWMKSASRWFHHTDKLSTDHTTSQTRREKHETCTSILHTHVPSSDVWSFLPIQTDGKIFCMYRLKRWSKT
jgi:hypothetical protein